ncbi:MAG: hypothetical protein KDI28_03590 [Pseudomonadales bacterium]|nr:hypothetical protein [Pseudomonadales bacterium]
MKTIARTLFGISVLACGINAMAAEDEAIRHYTYSLDGIQEVVIDGSVGTMEIRHSDSDELKVELELEGTRHMWVLSKRDVSDIELVDKVRGDRLSLSLKDHDVDHVKVHWRVELPSVERTRVNMGVGAINGEFGDTELTLDLGVGEGDIRVMRSVAGRVETSAGVGSAELRGASDVVSRRAMVSENTLGYGEGTRKMELSVGVGEMKVHLTDRTLSTAQSW